MFYVIALGGTPYLIHIEGSMKANQDCLLFVVINGIFYCLLSIRMIVRLRERQMSVVGVSNDVDYLHMLPEETWIRVFGYLIRNDVDRCERTCTSWNELIRRYHKYIPPRTIEYLLLSTRRVFSITACSGDIIKVYTFHKYFNARTVQFNINHPMHMAVETIVKAEDGSNKELFEAHTMCSTDCGYYHPDIFRIIDRAHSSKTKFKIGSPPLSYFYKLRDLLRNTAVVRQFVFQNYTLTDAFVEKFVKTTYIPVKVEQLRMHRTKNRFQNPAYYPFMTEHMLSKTEKEEMPVKVSDHTPTNILPHQAQLIIQHFHRLRALQQL
jgi:hypothetical protein